MRIREKDEAKEEEEEEKKEESIGGWTGARTEHTSASTFVGITGKREGEESIN